MNISDYPPAVFFYDNITNTTKSFFVKDRRRLHKRISKYYSLIKSYCSE